MAAALILCIVCALCGACASVPGIEAEGTDEEMIADLESEIQGDEVTTTKEETSKEKSTEDKTEEETEEESTEEETLPYLGVTDGILKYEDVRGYFFRTQVRTDWPLHDYDQSAFIMVNDRMTYDSEEYTYRLGIDVYEAYGNIDWEAVKNDGYAFVFLRCGYRGYGYPSLEEDDMVFENLFRATQAGLDVGVYFFSQAINEQEAAEEADFVINKLLQPVGYFPEKISMGIAYDPEYIGLWESRTNFLNRDQITKNAKAFCEVVAAAGYKAYVYSNMVWEDRNFDLSQLADYDIWYADYTAYPQTPYAFSVWQYGHGKSAGVEGAVDVNIQLIPVKQEESEEETDAVTESTAETESLSDTGAESAAETEAASETEAAPETESAAET